MKQLNNTLLVITKVKGLIATEEDIETFFDKSLDVLLEKRDYAMAWIGKAIEEDKKVIPMAQAGMTKGYLDNITITWDDKESSMGPTGRAIKERKHIIEKNNVNFASCQEEASRKNYVTSIALPIIHDDQVYGALNIYSKSKNTFIKPEIDLLQDLARNIGFAINKLRNKEKIKYLSFHDQLTGLYNRMFFNKELERLNVKRNLPLSIVVTDLNGLKKVNDNYGHKMGDKLLIAFAKLLREYCRQDDIICRWGGDEFALLFPKTPSSKTKEIISRIKEKVNQTTCEGIQLSSAFGYAVKTNTEDDIQQIFKQADNNMYQDKRQQKQSSDINNC